jgi:hypothetical protein
MCVEGGFERGGAPPSVARGDRVSFPRVARRFASLHPWLGTVAPLGLRRGATRATVRHGDRSIRIDENVDPDGTGWSTESGGAPPSVARVARGTEEHQD